MAKQPQGPLTRDHLTKINGALQQLRQAQETIIKAQQCGYDCQAHADLAGHLEQRLQAVKQQFFGTGGGV
jgi:hypothetical protein